MTRSLSLCFTAALAFACSRESPPPHAAPLAANTPMQTALVTTPEGPSAAPGAPSIPVSPPAAGAPSAPSAAFLPPDQVPLTPANGFGQPRPTSAAFAPSSTGVDHADGADDRESAREIRELIAADRALSASARQITVVVKQGRVWLRGQVTTAQDRASLEKLARQAGGVIDVRNELAVME